MYVYCWRSTTGPKKKGRNKTPTANRRTRSKQPSTLSTKRVDVVRMCVPSLSLSLAGSFARSLVRSLLFFFRKSSPVFRLSAVLVTRLRSGRGGGPFLFFHLRLKRDGQLEVNSFENKNESFVGGVFFFLFDLLDFAVSLCAGAPEKRCGHHPLLPDWTKSNNRKIQLGYVWNNQKFGGPTTDKKYFKK